MSMFFVDLWTCHAFFALGDCGTFMSYALHMHQAAYQTGKSMETTLQSFVYKIDRALRNGLVLGAFQGVEGAAFNNTTFEPICRAAEEQQLHTSH
jgi:hypothetical protein